MSGQERESSNTSSPTQQAVGAAVSTQRVDVGEVEYTRDALGAWRSGAPGRPSGVGPWLAAALDALVAARAEREGLHTTIRTLMADLRTADAALAAAQQDAARWQAYKATAEMVSVGPGSGYYLTGKPVDGIVLPTADAYADALLAGEQPGKQPETDAEVPHVD